ncbi:unnamed protein product [Urochloa humidicola]
MNGAPLQGRQYNFRKLRLIDSYSAAGPSDWVLVDLFTGRDKMELLDLSQHSGGNMFLEVSSCSSLETLIIDGSGYVEIRLERCAKLKNPLLSGDFGELRTLRLIGCEAVEILDLSAVAAPKLGELTLLDCGKLRAILWPPAAEDKRKRYVDYLCIGTTQEEGIAISPTEFEWYVSVRDARLLGSLEPVKAPNHAHVEISTLEDGGIIKSSSGHQLLQDNATYSDVAATFNKDTSVQQQEANPGNSDAWAIMCACPPLPHLTRHDCYIHIEDQMARTKQLQTAGRIAVPGFICDGAKILDVHDSLSVTSILAPTVGSRWNKLEWCRIERCPKLECVFGRQFRLGPIKSGDSRDAFSKLRTIWASHLPCASCIIERSTVEVLAYDESVCKDLTLLHLHCCPRMEYAVPLRSYTYTMENLETLEITWCSDLTQVFRPYNYSRVTLSLPSLKRIHLHELPMLQALKLETIKIRGCWSLNTLPEVSGYNYHLVECDCEKEWWDKLKWSTEEQKYYYKPTHPRYYKKTMLRGSPLR